MNFYTLLCYTVACESPVTGGFIEVMTFEVIILFF